MSKLRLVCKPYEPSDAQVRIDGREIFVYDEHGDPVAAFDLMRWAIHEDVQNPEGSGATALDEIRRIESGETDRLESDGNAWVTYITPDKVWFEGLYSQGEGGEVSFEQYKLAVETYVRFLSDPEHRPIEVEFPGLGRDAHNGRWSEGTRG